MSRKIEGRPHHIHGSLQAYFNALCAEKSGLDPRRRVRKWEYVRAERCQRQVPVIHTKCIRTQIGQQLYFVVRLLKILQRGVRHSQLSTAQNQHSMVLCARIALELNLKLPEMYDTLGNHIWLEAMRSEAL